MLLYRFALSRHGRGTTVSIGVNLTLTGRLKPQLHKLAPACAGFKTLEFSLVTVGELCLYSREFQDVVGKFGKPNPQPHREQGKGEPESPSPRQERGWGGV